MRRILSLATMLTLILAIAASSFAGTNAKVNKPTVKAAMLKEKAVKKIQIHRRHHRHRWHRKHRRHR